MSSLKKRTQQGFTIVELLIVIVVIGILAALVITTYTGIQKRGRDTERQTDLKAVKAQLEAYYANKGYYPSEANLGSNSGTNVTFVQNNLKGLDEEALRDPKAAAGNYALANTATANQYAYAATPALCDNSGTECTGFTLTAVREGEGGNVVETSSN